MKPEKIEEEKKLDSQLVACWTHPDQSVLDAIGESEGELPFYPVQLTTDGDDYKVTFNVSKESLDHFGVLCILPKTDKE